MLRRCLFLFLALLSVSAVAQTEEHLATCKSRLQSLGEAVEKYHQSHGRYPTNLAELKLEALPTCPTTTLNYRAKLDPDGFKLMCLGKAHPGLTSTESDIAYTHEDGLVHPYDGPPLTESEKEQYKEVIVQRREGEFYDRYGIYLYSVMFFTVVFVVVMALRDRRAEDRENASEWRTQ